MTDVAGPDGAFGVRRAAVLTTSVVAVVFLAFVANAFIYVLVERPATFDLVAAGVLLVGQFVLQMTVLSHPGTRRRSRAAVVGLATQAVLALAPVYEFGQSWLGMAGFLAGSALVVVGRYTGWVLFGLVCVACGGLALPLAAPLEAVYWVCETALTGLVVYGLAELRRLVRSLTALRRRLATTALVRARTDFAEDLQELLDDRLSSIVLKSELTRRLLRLPSVPDPTLAAELRTRQHRRAAEELGSVRSLARRALTDIRSAARGYRQPSLADELVRIRAELDRSGVDGVVRCEVEDPGAEVGSVITTVLRETIGEVLARERLRRCTVVVSRPDDARVRVEVVADGVPDGSEAAHAGLRESIAAIGGTVELLERRGPDTLLLVEVPCAGAVQRVPPPTPGPAGAAWSWRSLDPVEFVRRRHRACRDELDTDPGPGTDGGEVGVRGARRIVIAVLTGYAANGVVFVLVARPGPGGMVIGLSGIVATYAIQIGIGAFYRRRVPWWPVVLLVQAVCVFGPMIVLRAPLAGLPGFLAGSALLVHGGLRGASVFALTVVGTVVAHGVLVGGPVPISYGLLATVNQGLVVYAMCRVRTVVSDLHRTRSDLATLAVVEERARFGRDLHDLLGYSISAIALKAELAERMVDVDPARSTEEVTQIQDIASEALGDVRSRTATFRRLTFEHEVDSVRSVLRAAGIQAEVRSDPVVLTGEAAAVLAVVLRECVTNLLRHSDARRCRIELTGTTGPVRLTVSNDGLPTDVRTGEPPGSGLANLATRLDSVGGSLGAQVVDDEFRVRAEVPARVALLPGS